MTSKRHKDDFEDDGRVIADMSAVERPSLLGHAPQRGSVRPFERRERRPRVELTTKERLWMAAGAFKAGMTVGCIYVVFLGVIIFGLLAIWIALSSVS